MTRHTFPQLFALGWWREHPPPEWASAPDTGPGLCAICGGTDPNGRWRWNPGDNFADHDLLAYPDSRDICAGCRLLSKEGPERNERGNWRKWTLYTLATTREGSQSRVLLKDRKPEIRQLIQHGWLVAINDSGKKHVGFWGPDPRSRYLPVTFDRDPLLCSRDRFLAALELCDTLYTAGVSKAGLETAEPSSGERRKAVAALGHTRAWELLNQLASTPPLPRRAAAWLAQKEEQQ